MKNAKLFAIGLLLTGLFAKPILADCIGNAPNCITKQTLGRYYTGGAGWVFVGVMPTEVIPTNACTYFGDFFLFDGTTPQGKNMLSVLAQAKATGATVDIGYTTSSTPGQGSSSCIPGSTMSQMVGIGLSN